MWKNKISCECIDMPPKKQVKMTKKKFVTEHNKLVGLLSTTAKKLTKEANEQKAEMKRVKSKK
jgi:hypothetical protein